MVFWDILHKQFNSLLIHYSHRSQHSGCFPTFPNTQSFCSLRHHVPQGLASPCRSSCIGGTSRTKSLMRDVYRYKWLPRIIIIKGAYHIALEIDDWEFRIEVRGSICVQFAGKLTIANRSRYNWAHIVEGDSDWIYRNGSRTRPEKCTLEQREISSVQRITSSSGYSGVIY